MDPDVPEEERNLGRVKTTNDHFSADAHVLDDGRITVRLDDRASKLTKYLESRSRPFYHGKATLGADLTRNNNKYETRFQAILGKYKGVPRINIAIFIVGSRGDVQPFLAIAKV